MSPRYWVIGPALVLLCCVLGLVVSALRPPSYGAMALLELGQTLQNDRFGNVIAVPLVEASDVKTLLDVGYRKIPGPSGAYLEMVDLPRPGEKALVLNIRGPSLEACREELNRIEREIQKQYQGRFQTIVGSYQSRLDEIRREIARKQHWIARLEKSKKSSDAATIAAVYQASQLDQRLSALAIEAKSLESILSRDGSFNFRMRESRFWGPGTVGSRLAKAAALSAFLGCLLFALFVLVFNRDLALKRRLVQA